MDAVTSISDVGATVQTPVTEDGVGTREARLRQIAADLAEKRARLIEYVKGRPDAGPLLAALAFGPARPEVVMQKEANRHAQWCGHCGRDIAPDDPLVRYDWTYGLSDPEDDHEADVACTGCVFPKWVELHTEPVKQAWREAVAKLLRGERRFGYRYGLKVGLHDCAACGRSFICRHPAWRYDWAAEDKVPHQVYCCQDCRREGVNARRRVDHDTRPCDACGERYTPTRSDGRYCTPRCRQAAYRARKAAP
jgi:hypothetical protein